MERKVFSNPDTAETLNDYFVNVKVDREQRPALDKHCMSAIRLISRTGGWPNIVFLTPDQKPFFAGTYLPPGPDKERPGFPDVIRKIHRLWSNQRQTLRAQAERIAPAMERIHTPQSGDNVPLNDHLAQTVVKSINNHIDSQYGRFGCTVRTINRHWCSSGNFSALGRGSVSIRGV